MTTQSNGPSFPLFAVIVVVFYVVGIVIGYGSNQTIDTTNKHVTCFVDGSHIHCLERAPKVNRQPVEVYVVDRHRILPQ